MFHVEHCDWQMESSVRFQIHRSLESLPHEHVEILLRKAVRITDRANSGDIPAHPLSR